MSVNSRKKPAVVSRLRWLISRRWVWALVLVFLALWFGHGPVMTWAARAGLNALEPAAGVVVRSGSMTVRLTGPIVLRDLSVVVVKPEPSTTDIRAREVRLTYSSLWNVLFRKGNLFDSLEVDELTGTLDVRPEALPPPPFRLPTLTAEQSEQISRILKRLMPARVRLDAPQFVILGPGQVYTLDGLAASFDERSERTLTLESARIEAGPVKQVFKDVQAATGWKTGVLSLHGAQLADGFVLRAFSADFVRIGGIGLAWVIDAAGGVVRGDIAFGERGGFFHIDGALSLYDIPLENFPALFALPGTATGRIRDGRITVRGNPDFPMDAELALRLSAEDFRWNDRGWQSLEIGATYIGRRLYLSNFHLAQESNLLSANGEASIPEDFSTLPKSRFLLNVSAEVKDVQALASLIGPELGNLHGQLDLHGSVSGNDGELDGYVNAAANDLQVGVLPRASAKVSAVLTTKEVQIRHAEIWSGDDRVNAHGSMELAGPHRYVGGLSLKVADLGLYLPAIEGDAGAQVYTGSADLNWQGDGTMNAHSGAFQATLENLVTAFTPTGLTGDFAGTYSPENFYFGTLRLTQGELMASGRLTLSNSGINVLDVELLRSGKRLLNGEAFVPLNVFALARGESMGASLSEEQPIYARCSSGTLQVPELLRMVGQEADATGTLSLNLTAQGRLPELAIHGKLEGRDLTAKFDDFKFPSTALDLALATADRRAQLSGRVAVSGFEPLTIQASMPFAFERLAGGGMRWFDENAPVTGQLRFPDTSLEIFRPLIPQARTLAGTLRGSVDLTGTLSEPVVQGGIRLSNGQIEWARNLPVGQKLDADITFDAQRMQINHLRGEVGAGPFELKGLVDYSDTNNPRISARLTGDNVLIYRDAGFRLRADLDLSAEGSMQGGGGLRGEINLVDGRIYRRLEITPLLVRSRVDDGGIAIPVVSGLVPDPWSQWTLDVRLRNGNPFLLVGNLATGEISPDLTLSGTFGNPTLNGVIRLQNLQAYLPASDLIIPDGQISFTARNPFMPIFDVRGYADVSGVSVQAYAYGPLSDANFALRSDPPMSRENLIFLVTTGVAPVGLSGAGLGTIAVGQGSVLILRSFARQLEPFGINVGGFVNRIGLGITPPRDNTQGPSLNAEFRVTDRFSLTSGTDGYGFFNAGMQYTIRFR